MVWFLHTASVTQHTYIHANVKFSMTDCAKQITAEFKEHHVSGLFSHDLAFAAIALSLRKIRNAYQHITLTVCDHLNVKFNAVLLIICCSCICA